jgi:DNA (cytosine-5)-methyltransferase 1
VNTGAGRSPLPETRLTHISLFSGIPSGGIDLAAHWAGFETIAFVERDPYCQRVLAKNFPGVPIHGDIREFDPEPYRGAALISGGFPCQNVSSASADSGALGIDGALSGLWWEAARIIAAARPRWALVENVYQLVSRGIDRVASTLEQEGYRVWEVALGAGSAGAPHRRKRIFLVAHADRQGKSAHAFDGKASGMVGEPAGRGWQHPRPRVCGVDDGLPNRVERLRALGNAVVPAQCFPILKAIADCEGEGVLGADLGSLGVCGRIPDGSQVQISDPPNRGHGARSRSGSSA